MDIWILVAVIVFTFLAFSFEWLRIDAVALSSLGLLLLFGLVTPQEAIRGFSNDAVITVMMMFILSYGLTHTGLIDRFGQKLAQMSGHTHWAAAIALILVCGVLSAFINNTAALAILMPVGIQIGKHYGVSPSRILLPLSYLSIIGGTCTLIGTSTNLLVASMSAEYGFGAFSMFEFLALGLILLVVGFAYIVFVPMRRLPDRAGASDLTTKYQLSSFLTEVQVPEGSSLIGNNVVDAHINERFRLTVLEILRGEERIAVELRSTPMQGGDILIVEGLMDDIVSFRDHYGLRLRTETKIGDRDLSDQNNIMAEIQLSPVSRLTGSTIRDLDFRRRFGCFVLALNRTGDPIREKLAHIVLHNWDTLLVFGPRSRIEALYETEDFIPLQQDVKLRLVIPRRWWLAVVIIPIVVIVAAAGVTSILKASILGAVALIVFGGISVQQAYEAINWTVIFLLVGILPMGIAMEKTGLAAMIGETIANAGADYGPWAVIALVYLATALLSEIVSNNSTAVLMVPIAGTAAASMGLEPKPFMMTVAFAASASFLTPMGYQTNAMVFGPGGYRFMDYVKFGAPLKIVFCILSVWLIPQFWPLT